jgi:hypothetical protein
MMENEDDPEFETPEVTQRRVRDSWAERDLWAITCQRGFFTVHFHTLSGSIYPPIDYATPHEAIARVMQLMGIEGPIAPQSWPERVQIGSVS